MVLPLIGALRHRRRVMQTRLMVKLSPPERAALARLSGERAARTGERLSMSGVLRELLAREAQRASSPGRTLDVVDLEAR